MGLRSRARAARDRLESTRVWLAGCSLYFDDRAKTATSVQHRTDGGSAPGPDARACPATGTHAEILYPLDGATNVPSPVPIAVHKFIPNTLDGIGESLVDSAGNPVTTAAWVASCSIPVSQHQTGPLQDYGWTDCYDFPPSSTYTLHIWITCYDPSGPHELAVASFTTAP
ncbi:hypothetical protein BH11MYX1_BH11MYX1_30540 [soil metagenome]